MAAEGTTMEKWQTARLIPTSGIGSEVEAESRATSALLAVLSAVRPFSKALLDPLGASRAANASVETFIEVIVDLDGRRIRPDGLIRVQHGTKTPWIALVEIKTGDAKLDPAQINDYWEIARRAGYDAILTISNEIALTPRVHPTPGLKVRANSKVQIHHMSWTAVLTEAVVEKVHRGVSDPEQAWILGELIRYLEHPASGALTFTDMGSNWTKVRDAARDSTLNRRSDEAIEVCERWDQLARFAGLTLAADIGEEVQVVLSKVHRTNPRKHSADLADRLCREGILASTLRIPRTAGDLEILADLRSQRLLASIEIEAPTDRGPKGSATWLVRQLTDAHPSTIIESWVKGGRAPAAVADLKTAREDSSVLVDPDKRDTNRFRIVRRSEMGKARKASDRTPGFVDTVLALIAATYEETLQAITPFQAPTPKVKREPQPQTDEPPEPTRTAIPLPPVTPPPPSEQSRSWSYRDNWSPNQTTHDSDPIAYERPTSAD